MLLGLKTTTTTTTTSKHLWLLFAGGESACATGSGDQRAGVLRGVPRADSLSGSRDTAKPRAHLRTGIRRHHKAARPGPHAARATVSKSDTSMQ